ncbi:hypothetical protein [Streptomyces nigrescens]
MSRKKLIATGVALLVAGAGVVVTQWLTRTADWVAGQVVKLVANTPNGPTLNVTVVQGFGCNGNGWIFPVSSSDGLVNEPPGSGRRIDGKSWDQNPAAFGATPAGPVQIYLTATGKTERPIILTGIHFRVEKRERPKTGTRITLDQACGDGVTYHAGAVSLSKPAPHWMPVNKLPANLRTDPLKFPYRVTAQDQSLLRVSVYPGRCDCKWRAELNWVDGEVAGKTAIDDHGHPFETTPSGGNPGFTWQGNKRVVNDYLVR